MITVKVKKKEKKERRGLHNSIYLRVNIDSWEKKGESEQRMTSKTPMPLIFSAFLFSLLHSFSNFGKSIIDKIFCVKLEMYCILIQNNLLFSLK